ncbi:MAG: hypothetical protein LUB63_06285, partial [Oscillospiraceae bacterium]|nr:hypothetical protein [Oscillospiraceae bacterium]
MSHVDKEIKKATANQDGSYNSHHGGYHNGHPKGSHPKNGRNRSEKKRVRKHSQWGDVWVRFRKNKLGMIGMILAAILVLMAILAPVLTPYSPATQDVANRFQMPSLAHLMGTDNFGRDLFTRVLYGGRTSLLVAVMALIFSLIVAIIIGAIAGYYGGWIEMIIMRIMD